MSFGLGICNQLSFWFIGQATVKPEPEPSTPEVATAEPETTAKVVPEATPEGKPEPEGNAKAEPEGATSKPETEPEPEGNYNATAEPEGARLLRCNCLLVLVQFQV